MFNLRRGSLIVLVLLLSLVVGCFMPASEEEAAPDESGGSSQTPSASVGTFRLLGVDPPTLDPHLAEDSTSAQYIVEIYSGLVSLNDQLQVVPDLAETWKVLDDGKTYEFTLRDGAKFQNGREVTADDVKYSLERAADPKTQSTVADTYLGDIVGVKDKLTGRANEISGVKVVDSRTVQITTDAPKAYFLAKLTYPTAFVVDRENIEQGGQSWSDQPNGTGPFKLAAWDFGERLVLERNDQYYGGQPKIERVEFNLAGGSPMTMYENGEIDATAISLSVLDRALDPSNPLNKELKVVPEMSVWYIGFNAAMPPFDDPKVRQAFNMAVDKDLIVKQIMRNAVVVANGPLPPGMPGFNDKLRPLGFDPARARQLIAESKYRDVQNLPTMVLSVQGTGGSTDQAATAIIEMWKQNLGVDVQIQQVEWTTFLQDLNKHQYQMYQIGWIGDYPDPQNFLDVLFHTDSLDNNMEYSNPQVDRLLEQARTEADPQTRLGLYQQAEQLIVDDAAWLPLWHPKSYVLVKPYVLGYNPAPMVVPTFKNVEINR